MELEEYSQLYKVERTYWWHVGLRRLLRTFIDNTVRAGDTVRILDAGCGTGGVISTLETDQAFGFDISREALRFCKMRKIKNIAHASINAIPFRSGSFDIVIVFDILCQSGVDTREALRELGRVLRRGGLLLINEPAYNFLKSEHDVVVHTVHRFNRSELMRNIADVGLAVEKITYRNTLLFPLIAPIRLIKKVVLKYNAEPQSDMVPLPQWINTLFTQILLWENRLIVSHNLPFGLSVFCIAKKIA